MKQILIKIVMVLAVILVGSVCNEVGPLNSEIEIIPATDIPRPFSNSTYFIYGVKLEIGELNILNSLNNQGFALQDAWIPNTFGACMVPILKQMIVHLKYPNSKIYSLGFTSDSTQVQISYCIETWKHYRFYR